MLKIKNDRRISAFETKFLRRIAGIKYIDRVPKRDSEPTGVGNKNSSDSMIAEK